MITVVAPRILTIGGGVFAQLPAILARLGVRFPLIVTDRFMVESGLVGRAIDLLKGAGLPCGVFAETVPDPTTTVIDTGVGIVRDGGYDALIAIGGGSPMDTAKAIAILEQGGGRMRDYKVPHQADAARLPVICVPTTAGTGSEVTRFAVITDVETDEKMLVMGLGCLPAAALVDFELTMRKPFRLTADTGIDALTHAIEAYVSRKANPFSDLYAVEAMALIWRHLPTACFEPDNRVAREAMMRGATLAGLAFSNASVALVHGMSRPIGAFFHVPHGLSNAMLLPTITEFSIPGAPGRYADCARHMGLAGADVPDDAAAGRLLAALTELNQRLEVPGPAAYGIPAERYHALIPTMAEQAIASGSPANNPRQPSAAEVEGLYRQVWSAYPAN